MPRWLIYFLVTCMGIILAGPAGAIVALVVTWFVLGPIMNYTPAKK